MSYEVIYEPSGLPTGEWLKAMLARIDGTDEPLEYNGTPCFRFVYQLTEYVDRTVSVLTGTRFNPNTKMGRIVSGMMGREPDCGEEVDLCSFIGRSFEVTIEEKPSTGRMYYNVTAVRTADEEDSVPF